MVILEHCNNADNVGGVLRNAAAFGAAGVILSPGSVDPLYRKAIRTSMGAAFQVPFLVAEWPSVLDDLKSQGFFVAALTPDLSARSLDLFAAGPRPARLALLFGAEGDGLSAAALGRADARIRIPMASTADSLNVAVATGIALSRLSDVTGL